MKEEKKKKKKGKKEKKEKKKRKTPIRQNDTSTSAIALANDNHAMQYSESRDN